MKRKKNYGLVALYVLYGLVALSLQGINIICNFTCPEMGITDETESH